MATKLAEDFSEFLGKDDSYFSEGHLEAWFARYRGKTPNEVKADINMNHDNSLEVENAEDELGRALTDNEKEVLIIRFIKAVQSSLITRNDVVYGYYDSLEQPNYKTINE